MPNAVVWCFFSGNAHDVQMIISLPTAYPPHPFPDQYLRQVPQTVLMVVAAPLPESTILFPTFSLTSMGCEQEGYDGVFTRQSRKQQEPRSKRPEERKGSRQSLVASLTPPHHLPEESRCTATAASACFRRPQPPRNPPALTLEAEEKARSGRWGDGVPEFRRDRERAEHREVLAWGRDV